MTISSEELGRRRFQVLRDKAADEALAKIRRALVDRGQALSSSDTSTIREILREIWSGVDQDVWDSFIFTRLSREDIDVTLSAGGGKTGKEALPRMADALKTILQEQK